MPRLTALLIAFALVAASAVASSAKDFRFEDYFRGRTVAEGQFKAITGLKRTFTVNLNGKWNGKRLVLVEDFVFDDGTRDRKTWRFVKTGPNTYSGTREDVIGETTVTITGDTARFSYDVYLDGAARKNRVRFHDKMVLKPDGTVLNTALVTKFGFPVATSRVEFRRR